MLKKMSEIATGYTGYLIVFIATFVFLLPKINEFCTVYSTIDFDSQALLAWDYAAYKGIMPHKDIFYPYGILFYLRDQNIFFHLIYFLSIPMLFTLLFAVLKKMWKNTYLLVISFALFIFFILQFTGIDTFNRYGHIVAFASYLAYIAYALKRQSSRIPFFIGITSGVLFSLITDQGIYFIAMFSLYVIITPILRENIKVIFGKTYYARAIYDFFLYIAGFVIGFLPYLFYLLSNNSFVAFLHSIAQFSDIALYAKTPFIPSLRSPGNAFIFTILLLTLIVVANKIINKKKNNFTFYLQLFLALGLILLLQKSIVRSIDRQLTFIAVLLLFTLCKDFDVMLKALKVEAYNRITYICLLLVTILLINPFRINKITSNKRSALRGTACINSSVDHLTKKYPGYKMLSNLIRKDRKNSNNGIFSFPGDPIFYILFNQRSPYYLSVYEASPLYAQKNRIDYIENQNILYVIYNQKSTSIQDGVPDIIRGSYEFQFILKEFALIGRLNDFLILKRDKSQDILHNKLLDDVPKFKKTILDVDLEFVPQLEGRHKQKILDESSTLLSSRSIEEVNNFLKSATVTSDKIILILRATDSSKSKEKVSVTLITQDNINTRVQFQGCGGRGCIIRLSSLPAFFTNRIIKEIHMNTAYKGMMEIRENPKEDILW